MNRTRERMYRALIQDPVDRPLTKREKAKLIESRLRYDRRGVTTVRFRFSAPMFDRHRIDAKYTHDYDPRSL